MTPAIAAPTVSGSRTVPLPPTPRQPGTTTLVAPTSATADTGTPAPPTAENVQTAVKAVEQLVQLRSPNTLSFSIDEDTGRTIVRITDAETGETIRQIPAEEMLAIARALDQLQGLLLNRQA